MNNITALLYITLFVSYNCVSQGNYPPNASSLGTTAIHKDSSIFVSWAQSCTINRGYKNILDTSLGFASIGDSSSATGYPGQNGVVSLGDSGTAIMQFNNPVINGIGPDFAIFENAFNHTFLELAFVEVSSDGINFVRFPAYSETQTTSQINGFGELDPTNIHNLAGKYIANYGTPFDLEDIIDSTAVDVNNINYIKLVDVVGVINSPKTSYDINNNMINDPFPTPYSSSGFDLDAVGIIHQFVGIKEKIEHKDLIIVSPNPSSYGDNIRIGTNINEDKTIVIINQVGEIVYNIETNNNIINVNNNLPKGMYIVLLNSKNYKGTQKLIIN